MIRQRRRSDRCRELTRFMESNQAPRAAGPVSFKASLCRSRLFKPASEGIMSKNMRAVAVEEEPRPIAFDSLVLEHLDMLYAVALRFTRNKADTQDLTQDAVVKALRFHGSFEKGTYIKACLLTILRNTFINDYRCKTRRPALVELTGTEAAKSSAPDLEVAYEPSEDGSTGLMELLSMTRCGWQSSRCPTS